jgi:hypothetical protein
VPIDQQISQLDNNLRRLKVEYEAYFSGALPRAPHDSHMRVQSAVKRLSSTQSEMNHGQRFRFNQLAQRFIVYSELWNRRVRKLEEGREQSAPARESPDQLTGPGPATPPARDKVDVLFGQWIEARKQTGESVPQLDSSVFADFIREKTAEIKGRLGCERVEFRVTVEGGRVHLKAARS